MSGAILMIGPFPPPVHGASLVTARLADRLRPFLQVRTRDISQGSARGLAYHATRACRTLAAAASIVSSDKGCWVYLSAAGGSGLVYTAFLAAAARLSGRRLIVHHHSFAYINRRSGLMAMVAAAGGPAALHLALCRRMAERMSALYPRAARTAVLSNAFLFAAAPARAADEAAPLRLGHLSNLSREKGLHEVLALQADLARDHVASELMLAGGAADPADAAAIAAAVAKGEARHLGPLYDGEKDSFFAGLDVFLFPSRYVNEAEPLVVFEALAQGLPVLAYDRGCIAEQIGEEGGAAYGAEDSFAERAGAQVKAWVADRSLLRAAQDQARARMAALSQEAARQFAALLAILGVTQDAVSMGEPR